jgi:thiol-disulfide isomerase/thioredoxin
MHERFQIFLLLCALAINARSQDSQPPLNPPSAAAPVANIGDPAPPLRLKAWLKGGPIDSFKKDNVYILEFWATWCKPCVATMPHMSAIANKYSGKATVIGIDVAERPATSLKKLKNFVDSMGRRFDFPIAAEDSSLMVTGWLDGTGQGRGIPRTIVINGDGKIAWIGYPTQLDEVLPQILNNTWNMQAALTSRNERMRLAALDDSLSFELAVYGGDPNKGDYRGKPQEALRLIAGIVKKEPGLKYAPSVGANTFTALLKTDPKKACEYARQLMAAPNQGYPNYYLIYGTIEFYSTKLELPPDVYRLGAEACQAGIDNRPYPDKEAYAKLYHTMACFYRRANDKPAAIAAEQKATEMRATGPTNK